MTTQPSAQQPSAHSGPTTLTVRSPEDLIALAPVLLGFWPEESVVMLTFGVSRPFHARIDLPPRVGPRGCDPDDLRDLEELLLDPARRHGADAVVLLCFGDDEEVVADVHATLARGCCLSGIRVLAALHVGADRYRVLEGPGAGGPAASYDVTAHPFVVQAMVAGQLAHRSREELVASLAQRPFPSARVAAALDALGLSARPVPQVRADVLDEGRWVEATVGALVGEGRAPDDEVLARLLWAMRAVRVRDAAWSLIERGNAAVHVRWWSDLLPRVPAHLAAAPAALLGWAAWQAGDGARAWVAVDRSLSADPAYRMAADLATILQRAVPPEAWDPHFDWAHGLR